MRRWLNNPFIPSKEGLYIDFNRSIERKKDQLQKAMVIETVENLQQKLTKRELNAADQARRLCVIMGRPPEESFEWMIIRGKIINNPITITDFRNANKVYGKDLGSVKGKTTRKKAPHVIIEPSDGPEEKQFIVLSVDVMYLMGMHFLITVTRDVRFITSTILMDRKKRTVWNALRHVMNVYKNKGHRVDEVEFLTSRNEIHTILADNKFEMLREDIEDYGAKVNIGVKEELVPEVERQIKVIKERARLIVQTLPYDEIPKKMRLGMVNYIVFWLKFDSQE